MSVLKAFPQIIGIMFVGFFLSSCTQFDDTPPKEVLEKYIAALTSGDKAEAYKYLTDEDKNLVSLDEFSETSKVEDVQDVFRDHMTFEITRFFTNDDEDEAKAIVILKKPNISMLMLTLTQTDFPSKDDPEFEAFARAMRNNLPGGKPPMRRIAEEYTLKKEKTGWRVFVNYQQRIQRQKVRLKLEELNRDASAMMDDMKFAEAKQLVKQILKLDPRHRNGLEWQEELAYWEGSIEAAETYKDSLVFDEVVALARTKVDGKRVGSVRFTIRNNGEYTVDLVAVEVKFLSVEGDVVHQEIIYPVAKKEGVDVKAITDDYLYGGYAWAMVPGRFIDFEIGEGWKEGRILLDIVELSLHPRKIR